MTESRQIGVSYDHDDMRLGNDADANNQTKLDLFSGGIPDARTISATLLFGQINRFRYWWSTFAQQLVLVCPNRDRELHAGDLSNQDDFMPILPARQST